MAEFVRLVLQPPFIVHTETLPGLLPLSIMFATAILPVSASLLAASIGCPYESLVDAAWAPHMPGPLKIMIERLPPSGSITFPLPSTATPLRYSTPGMVHAGGLFFLLLLLYAKMLVLLNWLTYKPPLPASGASNAAMTPALEYCGALAGALGKLPPPAHPARTPTAAVARNVANNRMRRNSSTASAISSRESLTLVPWSAF